jgi:hypothetical protein
LTGGFRKPEVRPIQKHLWRWHEEDRLAIRDLAGKDRIVFVEMGDMTQGVVFKDNLAETELASQVAMAEWTIRPWLEMENVKAVRIVQGTGVHLWGTGSTEKIIASKLREQYPNKNINIANHYALDVDDFLMDIAHHGPGPGSRNWLKGNVLRLYAQSEMMDLVVMQKPVPSLMLRAHFHEMTTATATYQVGGKIWEMSAWITPPYAFINNHAQKAVRSPGRMGIGMLAFELINGKLYDKHTFMHYVDLRTREVV